LFVAFDIALEDDLDRFADGVANTFNIFLNSSILRGFGIQFSEEHLQKSPVCAALPFPSKEYWKCDIRQRSATDFHPTSTCRMGPNSTVAVVDSKLRVFGTTGLRVIDASVMPFVPSGNTNFPAIMIGEMGSKFILGQL